MQTWHSDYILLSKWPSWPDPMILEDRPGLGLYNIQVVKSGLGPTFQVLQVKDSSVLNHGTVRGKHQLKLAACTKLPTASALTWLENSPFFFSLKSTKHQNTAI